MQLMTRSRSGLTSQLIYEKSALKFVETITPSKGTAEKYTDGKVWVKLDRFGYESLAEVVSSRIVRALGFSTVEYRPCLLGVNEYNTQTACVSDNFVTSGCSLVTVGNIIKEHGGYKDTTALLSAMYKSTDPKLRLQFILDHTEDCIPFESLMKGIAEYVWLDSILLNTDRHVFNMVLLRKCNEWKFVNFDYGASLLSDLVDFPMEAPLRNLVHEAKAKPFSTRYSSQLKLFADYLPTAFNTSITLDVTDLYDYYDSKYIDRCCNILKQSLTSKGISLEITAKSVYTFEDFLRDPPILMKVMEKHWEYQQWFIKHFPTGAPSREAILNKLNEEV